MRYYCNYMQKIGIYMQKNKVFMDKIIVLLINFTNFVANNNN